jgi:hypothetical protein
LSRLRWFCAAVSWQKTKDVLLPALLQSRFSAAENRTVRRLWQQVRSSQRIEIL